jgi:hypothetical protein
MEDKDKALWEAAKQRVAFKTNLFSYIAVNLFMIAVWYYGNLGGVHNYFWPIWPILGWGLGVTLHGIKAYGNMSLFSVEKEYEKMKKGE